MTKDEWIQKAKALLFDCCFCVETGSIKVEIDELIEAGGGYDARVENSTTELKWHE